MSTHRCGTALPDPQIDTVVARHFHDCHVMLPFPDEGIIDRLDIRPQFIVKVDILVIGDEHAADSPLGECIEIAAVEKVDALIAFDVIGKLRISFLIGTLIVLDLAAVSVLKDRKLRRRAFAGGVGVDVPVREPFDGLVFQLSGQTCIVLGELHDLFTGLGVHLFVLVTAAIASHGSEQQAASQQCAGSIPVPFQRNSASYQF